MPLPSTPTPSEEYLYLQVLLRRNLFQLFRLISISLSPEKDKDSTISDEAKKVTVKLEVSDENITGQKFKRPMMLLMVKLVDLSLVQKISNASEIKDALEVYEG